MGCGIKAAQETLYSRHLEQIEEYVDWGKGPISSGTGPVAPKHVSAVCLIVGRS